MRIALKSMKKYKARGEDDLVMERIEDEAQMIIKALNIKYNEPFVVIFVALKKAFDTIYQQKLLEVLVE